MVGKFLMRVKLGLMQYHGSIRVWKRPIDQRWAQVGTVKLDCIYSFLVVRGHFSTMHMLLYFCFPKVLQYEYCANAKENLSN